MAVDSFPIFEVLVESVFGSIGLALLGVALALYLILVLTRNSMIFITYWMLFYVSVSFVMYLGFLGWAIMFILSGTILGRGIIKLFYPNE